MVTASDNTKTETQNLVQLFANAASERSLALRGADSKKANSLYRLMASLYNEIKNRGVDAQRQILPLLNHENPHVRVSAATRALEFDPQVAVPVLEQAQQERGTRRRTLLLVLRASLQVPFAASSSGRSEIEISYPRAPKS